MENIRTFGEAEKLKPVKLTGFVSGRSRVVTYQEAVLLLGSMTACS